MCTPKVRRTKSNFRGVFVVKYDEGFKQIVVNAYLAGEGGYASLASRFGIRSKTNIIKTINANIILIIEHKNSLFNRRFGINFPP